MGTDVGGRRVTNASPGITNPLVPPAGSPASRFHRGAPNLVMRRRTPASTARRRYDYSQTTPLNRELALRQRPGQNARHYRFRRLFSFETMPFSSFPPDIVLEIMAWCGPKDLQQLRLAGRLLSTLLSKNQYVWRLSRANLGLGFPIPVAARNEAALASYILNGGPCTVCCRPTTELPYSFALDIRICSAACSFYLLRVPPFDIDEALP
ncbi:hypothetical protein B0H11DRAFT_2206436 [Mycena galericulata]|nr:hypothetical protein B0H11DRAFT_2206436 [Mycena galericulata]